MSELVKADQPNSNQIEKPKNSDTNIIAYTNEILFDTRANLDNKTSISIPIAQLATLGAGVASMLPTFRTITQTTTFATDGLFRLANASVGDALKVAQNGNFWGAFKTANGGSKFAQLQSVGGITGISSTIVPIDPATIMMAIALFSIEQKLDSILQTEKQILSFLETEKHAQIESDVETLSSLLIKYKANWNNEHFVASNHKLVLDIQRTARKNLVSYQKQVTEVLSSKKKVISHSRVNDTLETLLTKIKYYRLSMYTFSMASFIEIMLSGNFQEENILLAKNEIEAMSETYRTIFEQCSVYLENLSDASLETNLLKGIGTASNTVGKFIDNIPVVRKGQLDEFLQESGTKIKRNALRIEQKVVTSFAEISNPGTLVFVEKLNDMIQIYGHTEEIYFDDKEIYLITH